MPVPSSDQTTVDTTKTTSSTSSKTAAAAKGPRVRTAPNVVQIAANR